MIDPKILATFKLKPKLGSCKVPQLLLFFLKKKRNSYKQKSTQYTNFIIFLMIPFRHERGGNYINYGRQWISVQQRIFIHKTAFGSLATDRPFFFSLSLVFFWLSRRVKIPYVLFFSFVTGNKPRP